MTKGKRLLMALTAVAASLPALGSAAAGLPIGILGDDGEAYFIRAEVTDRIPAATSFAPRKWLKPRLWKRHAAVVFAEDVSLRLSTGSSLDDPHDLAAVRAYLEEGGTVVFTGRTWAQLTATNRSPEVAKLFAFRDLKPWSFSKLQIGAGAAYCCTQSLAGVREAFERQRKPIGLAGGAGEWTLTPEGERIEAFAAEYRKVFATVKGVDSNVPKNGWGTVPLGPVGTIPRSDELKNKPVFKTARPTYVPGLKVFGRGVTPTIVYEKRNNVRGTVSTSHLLAQELANHLKTMGGCEAKLVVANPKGGAASVYHPPRDSVTVFVSDQFLAKEFFDIDFAAHPAGTAFLKRDGNWFLIGGNRSGASHALTYLLEAMGCRYLWPSPDGCGKIVPTGLKEVRFPEIDWTSVPPLKSRGVRAYLRKEANFIKGEGALCKSFGVEPADFYKRLCRARLDPEADNRDFWKWHGVCDLDSLEGEYAWSHAFGNYWDWYGKNGTKGEHLEFFALQPDGTRDLGRRLGRHTDRPTLCLSNEGLVDVTAENLIAEFKAKPWFKALSISLPDAGGTYQCMCEGCRKLDAVNAWYNHMHFGGISCLYPGQTDRFVNFANRVAAKVKKVFPDKKLCFYAYSNYTSAPYANRPDPMLVVLTVEGEYSRGSGVTDNFAKWASMGIPVYWRPNLLWGMNSVAPQNFARRLFSDIETCKANGLEGTDFDCYYDQWAAYGFVYYMLANALYNPDRLDYDTIADDYLKHAFGPAADVMKRYYDVLEKTFDTVAASGWQKREAHAYPAYDRALDIDALQKLFDEAKALAKDDPAVLRRLAYFECGLEPARLEKRIVEAGDAGDKALVRRRQDEFREWIRTKTLDRMPELQPLRYYNRYATPCLR